MKKSVRSSLFSIGGAVIAAAWLFAVGQAQAASPGAAVVKKVVGTANFTDPRGGGPIKEGDILFQGATISTGAGSYVDLDLGVNGNALRVEADSTLALNKLEYVKAITTVTDTQIEVKKGSAVSNVITKLSKASKYEIKTSSGVAGIRGTCTRNTPTRITCLIGTITFTPVAGGGVMITIHGGNAFTPGSLAAVRAGAGETGALAKTATTMTANTAAAMLTQVIQQFTAALAADAASEAVKAGGGADAAKAASDAAKTAIAELTQAVNDAAATASPAVRAAVQAVANNLNQNSESLGANAAAQGAGIAIKVNGGTAEQANAAANTAARQVSSNEAVVAQANQGAVRTNTTTQQNQNPSVVVDNRPPPGGIPPGGIPPAGNLTPGTSVIFVSPTQGKVVKPVP